MTTAHYAKVDFGLLSEIASAVAGGDIMLMAHVERYISLAKHSLQA